MKAGPLCSFLSPLLPGLGSAARPSGPPQRGFVPSTGLAPRPLPPQTRGRILLLQEPKLCCCRPSERPLLAGCSFSGSGPRSAGPACLSCVTSSCHLRLMPRPLPPHMRAALSQPFPMRREDPADGWCPGRRDRGIAADILVCFTPDFVSGIKMRTHFCALLLNWMVYCKVVHVARFENTSF